MLRRLRIKTPGGGRQEEADGDPEHASSEGFICPMCMLAHKSAEDLFQHYEAEHGQGGKPAEVDKLSHEVVVVAPEHNVKDLHTPLKDGEVAKNDIELAADLTMDGVEEAPTDQKLRAHIEDAQTARRELQRMKDLLEQKAVSLSIDVAGLKASLDEEKERRKAAEQRLQEVAVELQMEQSRSTDLHTQLLQRPGADDVEVLKTELVQVQTLMDKLSLEREHQSDILQIERSNTEEKLCFAQETILKLQNELALVGDGKTSENDANESILEGLRSKIEQLEKELKEHVSRNDKLQGELDGQNKAQQQLKGELEEQQTMNQQFKNKNAEIQKRHEVGMQALREELRKSNEARDKLQEELRKIEEVTQNLREERRKIEQAKSNLQEELQRAQLGQKGSKQEEVKLRMELQQFRTCASEAECKFQAARKEADEKAKEHEKHVAELDLKLSRLKDELERSVDCRGEVQVELEQVQQRLVELQASHQTAKDSLHQTQAKAEALENQCGEVERRLSEAETEGKRARYEVERLEKERHELCAKIESGQGVEEAISQLQERNVELQQQLSEVQQKLVEQAAMSRGEREVLNAELQTSRAQVLATQEHLTTLEASVGHSDEQLVASREKISQLDTQHRAKCEQFLLSKAEVSSLQAEQTKTQRQLQEAQEEVACVRQASEAFQKDLEEQRVSLATARAKLESSQGQEAAQGHARAEAEQEAARLHGALGDAQGARDEARRGLQQLQQEVQGVHAELAMTRETNIQAEQQHAAALAEQKAKDASLQERVAQLVLEDKKLKEDATGLRAQLEESTKMSKQLEEELQSKWAALESSKHKLVELGHRLEEGRRQIEGLQARMKVAEEEVQKQSDTCEGLRSELSAMEHDLKVSKEKAEGLHDQEQTMQGEMSQQKQQLQQLKQQSTTQEKQLEEQTRVVQSQDHLLKELRDEQARSAAELSKEKESRAELASTNQALEAELEKLKHKLSKQEEQTEEETEALIHERQKLEVRHQDLQEKLQLLQVKVETAQEAEAQAKHQVQKHEVELLRQSEELKAELEAECTSRARQLTEHEESEGRMQLQLSALTDNLATLRRDSQTEKDSNVELQKRNEELLGEVAVMEASLQNGQDERRALLERCVRNESESEKLQSRVTELRRKLEDAQAAMQELGRENQSLQIKQTQALSRKWTDDGNVQNCTACKKIFSVTIRRHHCRHCGNIFCAECSPNSCLTPSSKNPVRVCDACFHELQG
uniref:early endosome antigen 1 n=1 Tax=Myxine glutinosa TaxID=7769 RepID=UPI00358E9FF8